MALNCQITAFGFDILLIIRHPSLLNYWLISFWGASIWGFLFPIWSWKVSFCSLHQNPHGPRIPKVLLKLICFFLESHFSPYLQFWFLPLESQLKIFYFLGSIEFRIFRIISLPWNPDGQNMPEKFKLQSVWTYFGIPTRPS